jgi:uncharacterized membrane protein
VSEPVANPPHEGGAQPMALVIPVVLVVGVGLSAAVLVAGLALLVATGRTGYHEALTPQLLVARAGTVLFPVTVGDVLSGVAALRPFAVIELGVLLLIATPVLRVAASVILFFVERDHFYTGVTLVVLIILLISLFWLG